ncbi:MAG TPA: menaquinone biosynthesis protein [Saprospiraceae bacterium]|nr:menaquinone biosynthesis protein [Saprospiraceae bacterium]
MKYRIAAVSYVNTLPFLYGLQRPEMQEMVDVILAHPARCADLLEKGEVDIALCPVGALPELGTYHVITDYCIGCDGPVRTVSIYSNKPLSELTHVILFPESRTSNLLVQILNTEYWKYDIEFLPGAPDPELVDRVPPEASTVAQGPFSPVSSISSGSSGFLFIGDICFQKEKEYAYRTDLGQSWKEWTGMPFAFACWVSRERIEDHVAETLNAAFAAGIKNIDNLVYPPEMEAAVLREYLKKNISYELDAGKKEAMGRFLELTPGPSLTKRGE